MVCNDRRHFEEGQVMYNTWYLKFVLDPWNWTKLKWKQFLVSNVLSWADLTCTIVEMWRSMHSILWRCRKHMENDPTRPLPPIGTLLQKFVLGWNIVLIIFLVWSISLTSALILHRTAIVLLFSCGCLWYSSWHPRESFYSRGNIRSLEYQETC